MMECIFMKEMEKNGGIEPISILDLFLGGGQTLMKLFTSVSMKSQLLENKNRRWGELKGHLLQCPFLQM